MRNLFSIPSARYAGLTLALFLGIACLGGCAATFPGDGELHGQRILLAGTREYNEQVAKLKVSPAEAEEAAMSAGRWTWGKPKLLVGRSYVFSANEKANVPLDGIYVDGDSGTAHYITSDYVVNIGPFGNPSVDRR